jgi:hypothetical protein
MMEESRSRLAAAGAGSDAMMRAVADLHRAFFTGLVLAAVARRGPRTAAELVFAVFRRQQRERFLPGLRKLGLEGLPHAVAAAQYHYLSNRIGGVSVEYVREDDRKAWIRYPPPRWLWHGTAVCAVPGEVSRAMLLGWHAHNGVSLGNPRLGFVCTKQAADGQPGLEGYYLEHDRDLAPEERLRFARHEDVPDFDPGAAPWVAASEWPAERLRKAHRNYAMEYVRSAVPEAIQLFGPADAAHLVGTAGRLVGMQFHGEVAALAGLGGATAADFAAWMDAVARAQGDTVAFAGAADVPGEARFAQSSWALMRGLPDLHEAAFACWSALWDGALSAHNRRLELVPVRRLDLGDGTFEWRIRPRRRAVAP